MDEIVRVIAENGKRYKVALEPKDGGYVAAWVSVQMPGRYNRAGSWRGIDRCGPAGDAATRAAIEKMLAQPTPPDAS